MSFNKRRISDELIIESYRREGIDAVWKLYTKRVDALLLSGDLAHRCHTLICNDCRDELLEVLKDYDK